MAGIDVTKAEAKELSLEMVVEYIENWTERANNILGLCVEEVVAEPTTQLLSFRFANALTYVHDRLGTKLEAILCEIDRIRSLVG